MIRILNGLFCTVQEKPVTFQMFAPPEQDVVNMVSRDVKSHRLQLYGLGGIRWIYPYRLNSKLLFICFTLILAAFLLSCSGKPLQSSLTVATSANMQFVMEELSERFSEKAGIGCEIVISSSGILTAQIRNGAPYDVFVSADMKYPEEIYNSGLAASPPEIYAFGKLVLWTMDQNIQPSIGLLESGKIEHIAIANPKTAPYGKAALDVLDYFDLYDVLKSKLVYGESIAQTNQFIISRAADIGFTAMSVVHSPVMNGKGRWVELEASSYDRIAQGIVIIKRDNKIHKDAGTFYNYIFSGEAQKILMNFGYDVSE